MIIMFRILLNMDGLENKENSLIGQHKRQLLK